MSRKVLLVDSDVHALGALASALRARGLTVFIAGEAAEAVEQAFQHRPGVILAARDLEGDLAQAIRAVPELAGTPLLYLTNGPTLADLAPDEVLRLDLDHVVSRIAQASPREARPALDQEVRGNLEQMSLMDLLQLLAMNRTSGVLVITTAHGPGEVRLAEGEVIDAVYRRLEGEKAIYRLLSEREGRFAFTAGEPSAVRRILASTSGLLMEAMRRSDEASRHRAELTPLGEALLLDETHAGPLSHGLGAPPGEAGQLTRDIAAFLQIPRSVDELLDEMAAPDLSILEALVDLANAHKIRRIPLADLTTPFAPLEQLPVLRSLVTRLTRVGFTPPPRLVIAASAKRMPALAHAVRRITDAFAPPEQPMRLPLPRLLGTLRLGDGVELALIGLPTDEAFAPTWSMALPGAAAVVRLNDAGGSALEAHCAAVEVMLVDAEVVMGSLDVAVPGQVAALVRSALEMAAGV